MTDLIRRDLLLKEIEKANERFGVGAIGDGLNIAEDIIKNCPEVPACFGCHKEACKWRH